MLKQMTFSALDDRTLFRRRSFSVVLLAWGQVWKNKRDQRRCCEGTLPTEIMIAEFLRGAIGIGMATAGLLFPRFWRESRLPAFGIVLAVIADKNIRRSS
jgi:hypothetical protein